MDLIPCYYNKHTKIWSGAKEEPYYHPDCSLGKIIFTTMKNYPNKVIQIYDIDGVSLTSSEFITLSIRIAQHLKSMGFRHDDVIGITARNSTYVAPLAVACLLNCTPFHAVNPALDERSLKHIFLITKPKIIFCDGQDYDKVRLATNSFKPTIYTVTDNIDGIPKVQDLLESTKTEHFYRPETLTLGGDQTVAIQCSSGTTGMPKGVCISNYKYINIGTGTTSEQILYAFSGLDWMTGLLALLISCTTGATRIISNKPFSAEYFVEIIQKYKVTVSFLPPRHINSIINCPIATPESLASLRVLGSGGGVVVPASLKAFQSLAKNVLIQYGYGMSELGTIATNFGFNKTNSSGKIVPGVQVRIVDDNGKNLGYNEVGEIFVRHGKTWNGYYGNPFETQRILDSNGWYHTGDLGYFDEQNFLYVVDRKKDILKYQGLHYWPGEIEHCIIELPEVVDACVIGIDDETNGDLAGALVVKTAGSALSEDDIKNYVRKQLVIPAKQLHSGVVFVEKLPQNDNGKNLKRNAKEIFLAVKAGVKNS